MRSWLRVAFAHALAWLRAALVPVTVLAMLAGCAAGSKSPKTGDEDIDAMTYDEIVGELLDAWDRIDSAQSGLKDAEDEIARLNEVITGNQLVVNDVPIIGTIDDGTGRATFVKPETRLRLQQPIIYPNSSAMAASPLVSLSGVVSVAPSALWGMRIDGNSLMLTTDSGIYGMVSCGAITQTKSELANIRNFFHGFAGEDEVKNDKGVVVTPAKPAYQGFIGSIPANVQGSPGVERGLYIAGVQCGSQITVSTFINANPATIRAGLLSYKGVSVAYCFAYEVDLNSEKEDVLTALLNTMVVSKGQVSVE